MKVRKCGCPNRPTFSFEPPRNGRQRGEVSVFPGHRSSGGARVPVAVPEAPMQRSSPEGKV
eukprot:11514253-Alexandrium_andersonii.AAC.1